MPGAVGLGWTAAFVLGLVAVSGLGPVAGAADAAKAATADAPELRPAGPLDEAMHGEATDQERVRPPRGGRGGAGRPPAVRAPDTRQRPGRRGGDDRSRDPSPDRRSGQGDAVVAGFERLRARLGDAAPTGRGVSVAIVESFEAGGRWRPDLADAQFAGIDFVLAPPPLPAGTATGDDDPSGIPDPGPSDVRAPATDGAPSTHATMVARRFFGGAATAASGVRRVHALSARGFMRDGWLRAGRPILPATLPGVGVASHAWVGTVGDADEQILQRTDIVAIRDGVTVVAGVANRGQRGQPLIAGAWNVLGVGTRSAGHAGSARRAEDGQGGDRPFIVAPGGTTSEAVPVVASAAAILHEAAAGLEPPQLAAVARRAEVIIGCLLAGARAENTYRGGWSNVDRSVEAPASAVVAATPLDPAVGAGLLDVDAAHRIMTAGPAAPGAVARDGWHVSGPDDRSVGWILEVDRPTVLTAAVVRFIRPDRTEPASSLALAVVGPLGAPDLGPDGEAPAPRPRVEAITRIAGSAGMVRLTLAAGRHELRLATAAADTVFGSPAAVAWRTDPVPSSKAGPSR